jgi:hypothetical protein
LAKLESEIEAEKFAVFIVDECHLLWGNLCSLEEQIKE